MIQFVACLQFYASVCGISAVDASVCGISAVDASVCGISAG